HHSPIQIMTDVRAVAADLHTCATKLDNSLWCWGDNSYGAVGDGTTTDRHSPVQILTAVSAVAAGGLRNTWAIKTDKSFWCWGDDEYGQVGDGDDPSAGNKTSPTKVQFLFRIQEPIKIP